MGIEKTWHALVGGLPWYVLENAAIWALYFRGKHWSPFMHGAIMSLIAFCTGVSCLIELMHKGPEEIL